MADLNRRSWWLALLAVSATLMAPLLVVDVPPLQDYPNHLARLMLLAGVLPELAPYYEVSWAILPNLAMDLLGAPLVAVLPPHVAGRIVLGLAVLLPVLGVVAYHRAVFGGRTWWPLASALVAYNGVFLLGFINFLIGTGLALLGAAMWIRVRAHRPAVAVLGLAVAATVLFFCHLFAVMFLFLLVLGRLLGEAWAERGTPRTALRLLVLRLLQVAPALLPVITLYLASPLNEAAGEGVNWGDWLRRLRAALIPFASYEPGADLASALVVGGVFLCLVVARRVAVDVGSAVVASICILGFFTIPQSTQGGQYLELRFAIFSALMAFAGMQPHLRKSSSILLACSAAALLVLRLGILVAAWQGFCRDLTEFRRAIQPIEPGARVATVTVESSADPPYFRDAMRRRVISFLWARTELHLGALVVIERRAFWPALFAIPWQQPLAMVGPYRDFDSGQWTALPERAVLLQPEALVGRAPPRALDAWSRWQERFDYVLLLHAGVVRAESAFSDHRLELVSDTPFAALYRVRQE